MGIFSLMTGMAGASGFGSASTAEQVTDGIDASSLTAIITGNHIPNNFNVKTRKIFCVRNFLVDIVITESIYFICPRVQVQKLLFFLCIHTLLLFYVFILF